MSVERLSAPVSKGDGGKGGDGGAPILVSIDGLVPGVFVARPNRYLAAGVEMHAVRVMLDVPKLCVRYVGEIPIAPMPRGESRPKRT